jgi:hypothetical protein
MQFVHDLAVMKNKDGSMDIYLLQKKPIEDSNEF